MANQTYTVREGGVDVQKSKTEMQTLLGIAATVNNVITPLYFNVGNSTLSFTAMSAAESITSPTLIKQTDATNYTMARLVGRVSTVGSAGSKLIARYNATGSNSATVAGNWTNDLGTSEISIPITSLALVKSSWTPIAAGAKGDYGFCLVGSGGDGVTTPVLNELKIEFK